MKEITCFPHHITSATRISDLMRISGSLEPDLVILCFRNNQLALNDFNIFVKRADVPVLCLTRRNDGELRWNNSIVFTYPLEHIGNEQFLNSRIQSIFLLRTGARHRTDNHIPDALPLTGPSHHNADLSRYVMELDQKVEVLLRVKDRIANLYPQVDDPTRAELTSIVHSIKMSANDNKLWNDFKLYFEQTNPGFLLLLAERHPELTSKDLKYCCYLKMNMSNDDIRRLLGINQESVRTHKYRLKKKMFLDKDLDLGLYLRSIASQEI